MDGDNNIEDDERSIELSSIAAIFPELVIDDKDPFSASLDLAVSPSKPLAVVFPALTNTTSATPQAITSELKDLDLSGSSVLMPIEIRNLSHLPDLKVKIQLPLGYPSEKAPDVSLTSELSWLPNGKLRDLEQQAETLWKDLGQNQVIYDYLDLLQQAAENAFDLVPQDNSALNMSPALEVALLDYDLKVKRKKFEDSTFDCGVCLEPKKGATCYRLQECGHVFCIECLQNFYNNCITEGDVYSVKCLAPDCEQQPAANVGRQRIVKTLEASELIQIPLEQEQVQRYVKLLRKKRLESNKDTIYCPRKWCQGPARSSHQKDENASGAQAEDGTDSTTGNPEKKDKLPPPGERLCVCEDCGFAFCCVCNGGWHGEFAQCFPRSQYELTAEERASEAYLRKHSQLCPTCHARCQKTMGCNHMECFQCKTHFCYLCRAFLDRENPYKHFNTPHIACYMRLWELEEGDGEPGGNDGPGFWGDSDEEDDDDGDDDDDDEVIPAADFEQPQHAQQPPPPAPVPPNRNNAPPHLGGNRRAQGDWRPQRMRNPMNGLQRFLAMAAADEEDGWDSDELDDIDDI